MPLLHKVTHASLPMDCTRNATELACRISCSFHSLRMRSQEYYLKEGEHYLKSDRGMSVH